MKNFVKKNKKTIFRIKNLFIDLFLSIFPIKITRKYHYAFLVHSRAVDDLFRHYPFFRRINPKISEWFLSWYWPVMVSKITGLREIDQNGLFVDNSEITGMVIAIPMTAQQMLSNREKALKRIRQGVRLARLRGSKIIGLGGLTSSLTKGGLDLLDLGIGITTGHAYTAYNVTANFFKIIEIFKLDKKDIVCAIVGSAGSIGSTSAKIISRSKKVKKLILIDIERKIEKVKDLSQELNKIDPNLSIEVSTDMNLLNSANFILTATNTTDALIKNSHVSSGTVIIDDAQPSDVSDEVIDREDVLVLEAGVVLTPGIDSHFNFGLKNKFDNFCCMSEVIILASEKYDKNYVINRAELDLVDEISEKGKKLGFQVGQFQNRRETISEEKIKKINIFLSQRIKNNIE